MATPIYNINFDIDQAKQTVSPMGIQRAGVYGDDKVAKVAFTISNANTDLSKHNFRIEIVDGGGAYDVTELLDIVSNKVSYTVPAKWTTAGTATLRLVEVEIGENGDETAVLHYPPVYLSFADREDGTVMGEMLPRWQEIMTRLETSVDTAAASAADAAQAAREAQASASAAQHIASTVQKGDKGDPGGSTDEEALDVILAIQETLIGGKVTTNIDFVIEEGVATVVGCNSSGNTTYLTAGVKYRKWNSGHLEVFGTFTSPLITWSVAESGGMTFCVGSPSHSVLYFRDN